MYFYIIYGPPDLQSSFATAEEISIGLITYLGTMDVAFFVNVFRRAVFGWSRPWKTKKSRQHPQQRFIIGLVLSSICRRRNDNEDTVH